MRYQGFTVVIAEQTRPEFLPAIHDILRGGLFHGFTHPRATSPVAAPRTEQEWTDWLSDKAGAPFSDVGQQRTVAFHALGVRWTVHGRNEQDTVLALEEFISSLQILLTEFASLDPVLIPQDVDIEIRVYQPGHRPTDTYNHRLSLRHGMITTDRARQMADAFRAEALRAEQPNDPQIASDQITRDVMEQGIRLVAISSLHRWGLTLHHGTTDSDAIMQLIAERYGFWDDDIPHSDPFHGHLTPSN